MADFKPFRKIHTTDDKLNRLQDNLKDTFDALARNPLAGVALIPQVPLKAGTNQVHHPLGRNYVSWWPARPLAAGTLSESLSTDPTRFIAIVASAPVTVDLFVC